MNNLREENIQKYQLFQDNISYILVTSLIGINLKLTCHRYEGNINPNIIYSNIYTIEQLKKADQIFQIANDCEDVQMIFEEVILAKSVGILEENGFLDVYFYMSVSGRKAKVILRLNVAQIQKMPPRPTMPINNINNNMNNNINMNEYQKNQERLSKLQYDANQLIKEQNILRKQLNMFFSENENDDNGHERARSTNQNDKYYNNLNQYNNYPQGNNVLNNNMNNLKLVDVNDKDDDNDDIYEVPPTNDNE